MNPSIHRTTRWAGCGVRRFVALMIGLWLLAASSASAARIGDVVESGVGERALRFFTLDDVSTRYALAGTALLGVTCGLLGSFIVVRKMAMAGDALSHAVLPGVALGFLWGLSKDPWAILVGATVAGLLGTATVSWITRTTRLKEDTALGMVLAGFFSVGICLVTMIQRLPTGNKSGINHFLFGQAAAIGPEDLRVMAVITALAVGLAALFFKELLVTSFDPAFARSSGLPVRWVGQGLMLFLAFAVVIALKAVGVVLVSAMLIIPAATAYLLTDRMHRMLWLAAGLGVVSGSMGVFVSSLASGLPTGPLIVLSSAALFVGAFLLGPKHGLLRKWWRQRSRSARIGRENTLKSIYHCLEGQGFRGEAVPLRELSERRRCTLEEIGAEVAELRRHGLATLADDGRALCLTPAGRQRAAEIVRNHRLWELYLTHAAQIAPDHVHDDAEQIEHVLGEETVRQLERRLAYATTDPHGKEIPSLAEIRGPAPAADSGATGFPRRKA